MHSDHIDVSYFAAGIVAHLASSETGGGGSGHWPATIKCSTRDEILQDLVSEMLSCSGERMNVFVGRACRRPPNIVILLSLPKSSTHSKAE